jgi:membrane protein implicated in regulation of membrane protease activity
VGAWITALVCLFTNPGFNLQALIFAVTSVLALIIFRKMIQNKFIYNKDDRSGEVEDEFTGKEAVAVVDFGADRTGKVEFKGTSWKAESKEEIAAGQKVIILGKESFKLIVEPKNRTK